LLVANTLASAKGYGRVAEDRGHAADAGLPEAPQRWRPRLGCGKARDARHHAQKKQVSFAEAGFNKTFAGSVPTHTHVTRPSTDEDKISELVRLGTTNPKNMWIVCGATAFNSEIAMKAQAVILEKASSDAGRNPDKSFFERSRIGGCGCPLLNSCRLRFSRRLRKSGSCDKGDGTISGADLAAAMKFAHLKESIKRAELVQHH
jgi:hypothetical protein